MAPLVLFCKAFLRRSEVLLEEFAYSKKMINAGRMALIEQLLRITTPLTAIGFGHL